MPSNSSIPPDVQLFVANLNRRGITRSQANTAGIQFVPDAGSICAGARAIPAIYIPYFDLEGKPLTFKSGNKERIFARLRTLKDPPRGFAKTKPRRYLQPMASGVRAYFPRCEQTNWPQVSSNTAWPLLVTEGEFKALVACLNGFPAIGLGGVWNFLRDGVLLPELEQIVWKGRLVGIVFDSDIAKKAEVQAAERRLCAELTKRGAILHLVRLPDIAGNEKTGVDDFLLARGSAALMQMLENTQPTDVGKSLILEGTDVEIADSVLLDLADEYLSQVVYCEGEFYIYDQTHWRTLPDHQIRNAIFRYDKLHFKKGTAGVVRLSRNRADSVMSIMRDRATDTGFFTLVQTGINCANGFISFDANGVPQLEAHDRNNRQRHCLPSKWQPGASWRDARLLNEFLSGCFGGDADYNDKTALVAEICGVAALGLGTGLSAPKAIILFGASAENGKSEMLAMVRELLPNDAVCAVPPAKFADERMLIKLTGKKLNACDELGTSKAIESDTFKSVVTGNPVMGKELYKPAVSFAPNALNIYATNVLPPFHGGFDRGVQRRLLVLTFNRSIPKAKRIAEIGKRIAAEEIDALLDFAVEGAARVIKAKQFSEPPSSRETHREWVFNADPVLAWLAIRTQIAEGHRTPTKQAYADFQEWATTEGIRLDRLPQANTFVSRLLAQDGRIANARDSRNRFIVGLKIQSAQSQWAAQWASAPDAQRADMASNVVEFAPVPGCGQ